eukprot:1192608-Prorocentrum_minimum.AAC.2
MSRYVTSMSRYVTLCHHDESAGSGPRTIDLPNPRRDWSAKAKTRVRSVPSRCDWSLRRLTP